MNSSHTADIPNSSIYTEPCRSAAIAAAPDCAPSRAGPWVLAATILASSMAFIDGTVVNVALPLIQRALNADAAGLQWVVESYALFLAALLLVGGALGDHFGRRRVFVIGVAVFAAASLWCGLSTSMPELIVARAVQGVGAALLVPGSLALIGANFSKEQRGRAIGTWSAATAMTMAFGPVLGAWLAETFSWPWIFFINLPVAAVVLLIALTRVPESGNGTQPLDWPGAALATIGLGALVFGLIEAGRLGFGHLAVQAGLAAGVLALAGFVWHQLRAAGPMVPPDLFASPTFTGANLMTLLLYGALGGALFFLPLYLIQVQGYSATMAAAAFLPFVVLVSVLSRWSGALADRIGPRLLLIIGPAIAAIGFALLAVPGLGTDYWSEVLPGVAGIGLGMAVTVAPLTTAVMTSAGEAHTGTASGINNAASRIAALIAIAAFGLMVVSVTQGGLHERLADMLPPETVPYVGQIKLAFGAVDVPAALENDYGDTIRALGKTAFAGAYRLTMGLAAFLALASAAIAWAMVRRR